MAKRKKVTTGPWSKDELKLLRKLYPNTPTAEVAKTIGRPPEATKKQAYKLGLHKSKKYLKTSRRA